MTSSLLLFRRATYSFYCLDSRRGAYWSYNVHLLSANSLCEYRQSGTPRLQSSAYTKPRPEEKGHKTYSRALKKCGLWQDPVYIARKVELGDRIDAVRERMPKCVVKDVRARFPNPPGIPYMGHKREWDRSFLPSPFLRAFIEKHTLKVQNRFGRVVTSYNFFVCDPTFLCPKFWSLITKTQQSLILDTNLKFTDPDSMTCNTRSRGCDPRYQGDPRFLIPFLRPCYVQQQL